MITIGIGFQRRTKSGSAPCAVWGVGVIGIGMLLTAVLFAVTGKLWSLFAFVGGFLVGIVMLIRAIGKYNR